MDRQVPLKLDGQTLAGGDSMEAVASQLLQGTLLATAGGFLDGFTYVGHGHVFANAMTGNVVLLGINIVSGSLGNGLRHLPPILMFLFGVTVAKWLEMPRMAAKLRHPHLVALGIQITGLAILALLPQTTPDVWFTTAIAFTASVQVESFRKVHGRNYNSTFTTGNLRTFAESSFAWFFTDGGAEARSAAWDFGMICLAFFAGAAIGGFSTMHLGNRALWLDVALLILVALRLRLKAAKPPVS